MLTYGFNMPRVDFRQEQLLFILSGLRKDYSLRIADKRITPEFNTRLTFFRFITHPVGRAHLDAAGNGMAPLHRAPRVRLCRTEGVFFLWMPSYGCGI